MDEHQQRDLAAQRILEAMQNAIDEGASSEVVKLVTLSAAVTNFVSDYGEEATASIVESLPDKIRNGAFTRQEEGESGDSGAGDDENGDEQANDT